MPEYDLLSRGLKAAFAAYDIEEWSESDTRSKFIDYVLLDTCGHIEAAIRREKRVSGQLEYLDYLITHEGIKVVIEAKRTSVKLIKSGRKQVAIVALGSLLEQNKGLNEHVDQALLYGTRKGASFVVLTNGTQWILFRPFMENIDQAEIPALVIPDLVDGGQLGMLMSVLSPEAIGRHELDQQLGGRRLEPALRPLYRELPNETVEPRELERELVHSFNKFFRDAGHEMSREMVLSTWVNPSKASLRDPSFGVHFYTHEAKAEALDTRKGVESFRDLLDELSGIDENTARVVPVIGEAGTGKTHFLRLTMVQDSKAVVIDDDFVLADSEQELETGRIWIYADLRKLRNLPTEALEAAIFSKILDLLYRLDSATVNGTAVDLAALSTFTSMFPSTFKKFALPDWLKVKERDIVAYQIEVNKAHEQCKEQRAKYLATLFRYLVEKHKVNIRLVIDNTDQLEWPAQRDVYLFVQAMAAGSKAVSIVALRASWYAVHKSRGVASAFSDFVYALAPVATADILNRRLELIEENLKPAGTDKLGYYFVKSLRQSMLKYREVAELYEGLSNDSARRGMALIAQTTKGSHLNTDDIRWSQSNGDEHFHFKSHQLLPAIVGGRFVYYDEVELPIPNLYDLTTALGTDHWFKLQVLDYLDGFYRIRHAGHSSGFSARGKILPGLALAVMQPPSRVVEFLDELEKAQLVRYDVPPIRSNNGDDNAADVQVMQQWKGIRITTLGRYLFSIKASVTYLSAMLPCIPLKRASTMRDNLKLEYERLREAVPIRSRIRFITELLAYLKADAEEAASHHVAREIDNIAIRSPKELCNELIAKTLSEINVVRQRLGTSGRRRQVR